MAKEHANFDRVCVSIPMEFSQRLRREYPHREFSQLIYMMLMMADKAGFIMRLSDIKEEGSVHGRSPRLRANKEQLAFAVHAFRYICRITADTASEDNRRYLLEIKAMLADGNMPVVEYDALITSAHDAGWDNSSQDDAPIPKEGNPHPRFNARAAARVKTAEQYNEEVVASVAIIEEVEEFGA